MSVSESPNYVDVLKQIGLNVQYPIAIGYPSGSSRRGERFTEALLKSRGLQWGSI